MATDTLYRELYALFDGVTPLSVDCGQLCSGACCKGGDEPAGMRLFPGEETAFDGAAVIDTPDGGRLLTCSGRCDREKRPLACRIFPLFPYLSADGRIRAVWDPRALRLCPLVQARYTPDRAFIRAVRRAGRRLTATPEGRRFLQENAAEIDAVAALIPGWQPLPRRRRRNDPR
ncbi:MAG: hypothetical protein IJZ13_00605 [Clostridia bacterium]|nr:hypothetical protein [Clostridia bacterium]